MGKNKNKKGKGSEKTAAKTEKKLSKKQKKELADLGEEDVETIVAQIEKEEKSKKAVVEVTTDRPLARSSFTFIAHPEKDELILFGGEHFDGRKTTMFNDLLFYNISRGEWTCIKAPGGPAPRSGHQMVVVPGGKGGQLWVYGGEFTSPTQLQFYHYKDFYVFHLGERRWEKINCAGAPQGRSGHRMVLCKKQIIVFGGYSENSVDYKYFNDLYAFDLKDYKWTKLNPSGTPPSPRSGFQMATLPSGKVLISGGYSRQRVKKDVDKGIPYTDSFLLTPEKGDETGTKWKWVSVKLGGISPYPRSSMGYTTTPTGRFLAFGGVRDEEQEEEIAGIFHNDLYSMDLERTTWNLVTLSGKRDATTGKPRRRRRKEGGAEGEEEEDMDDDEEEKDAAEAETMVTSDDGIFKVTVGPSLNSRQSSNGSSQPTSTSSVAFVPSARMNSGMAVKQGKLYLYGGFYEQGDKIVCLSDLYVLDLHKLDEWQTLMVPEAPEVWLDSSSSEDEGDEEDDDQEYSEGDEDGSPMDTE